VLEVGCGGGDLVRRLEAVGYSAAGVDPDAPAGPPFRRATIEELEDSGPYDAVVASRSLHHVSDLAVALDKVASLLGPGGRVVIDEFAWERFDARSAECVGIPLQEWRAEHQDLHTSDAMLAELDRRFSRRSFSWEPYLHREAREAVTEEVERRLIDAGELRPIGFRYVGVR
jgi:2-polyprenyl-3-methyl-5-hydroxy-6-metoxy-1,4-benzoquinol methylase